MRAVVRWALAAAAAGLVAVPAARAQQADTFPHAKHAKVFPSCTGCHAGMVTKDAAIYPGPSACAGCHDGQQTYEGHTLRTVNFRPPVPLNTNLAYSHLVHADKTNTGGNTRVCLQCHQAPGTTEWLNVAAPQPQLCITCHAHAAPAHLATEANCRTCHVPLAQAVKLTPAEISAFPKPASHDSADWLLKHPPTDSIAQARCAICHTQQSCARCHMNVATTPQIKVLGSNPAVAQALAGKEAQYPRPATHDVTGFASNHSELANAANATCGNCHARSSCQTCHLTIGAREAIGRLPAPKMGVGAQGVQLRRMGELQLLRTVNFRNPVHIQKNVYYVQVHAPGWDKAHRAAASTNKAECAACHVQRYCSDCHDGVGRIKYHTPDFVMGHGAQAFGREQDCATCHNNEAFCVSCHSSVGIGSTGIKDGSVHNQSANWLVDHGQAARLNLQSCTSCHKQSDCMRCHSTTTWGINPHGPNFDANKMYSKNAQVCYYCHVGNPLGK